MKKDTVIFINIFPLGSVFADSLGMDLFEQAGYKLVYIDLSKIYYPQSYKRWGEGNSNYNVVKDFFIYCQTKEEVMLYIKKYANRAWFFPLWYNIIISNDQLWILRAFKKYGCDYILQDFFPEPAGIRLRGKALSFHLIIKLIENLRKFGLTNTMSKILGKISLLLSPRNIHYKKPSFCFVAGKNLYNQFNKLYSKFGLKVAYTNGDIKSNLVLKKIKNLVKKRWKKLDGIIANAGGE